MRVFIAANPETLGRRAAEEVGARLREAISRRGEARLVLSTGLSQVETLAHLVKQPVDWSRVTVFHLDEYVGLPEDHPASFRRYLRERFFRWVSVREAVLIDGNARDLFRVVASLERAVREKPIDVGLIGIGENAHIAFNDPPADFVTQHAFHVVTLAEACRQQQVSEGWFATRDEVPPTAISMTPYQILQCGAIVSAVPHEAKARAVYQTLTHEESPEVPATFLRRHPQWSLYLDTASASLIDAELRQRYGVQWVS
ncbi:MAG: glucosamine-6-phosphate deaminase [Firmicutes bacterium]|nr:glucosamine-6-phosphate deaminase [Bacillota bacterium]